MHLSLKLVASAMPYSLFLEQVKITHLFSKKKKKKIIFKKIVHKFSD